VVEEDRREVFSSTVDSFSSSVTGDEGVMVTTARGGHRSESQNCLPQCVDVLFGSRMVGAAHVGLINACAP